MFGLLDSHLLTKGSKKNQPAMRNDLQKEGVNHQQMHLISGFMDS